MGKNNMIVARIQQHTSAGIGRSERHNERKNETYENINVDPERIHMNLHFKDPCGKSYFEIFKENEEAGEISTRGLRADATLVDEMIDVLFLITSSMFAKRFSMSAFVVSMSTFTL